MDDNKTCEDIIAEEERATESLKKQMEEMKE